MKHLAESYGSDVIYFIRKGTPNEAVYSAITAFRYARQYLDTLDKQVVFLRCSKCKTTFGRAIVDLEDEKEAISTALNCIGATHTCGGRVFPCRKPGVCDEEMDQAYNLEYVDFPLKYML